MSAVFKKGGRITNQEWITKQIAVNIVHSIIGEHFHGVYGEEEELMNNLISREAILKYTEKRRQDALIMDDTHEASIIMCGMNLLDEAVRNQPSAQPKQQWIPVTERLPELNTDVLLSVRQGYAFGEPDNWCVVGGLIDKEDITWATNYGFHDLLYSNGKKHTVWVSAWMPLPEPYKEGEQNG